MDKRQKISEEAFAWVLLLESATPEEREQFIQWLSASAAHLDEVIVAVDTIKKLRMVRPPLTARLPSRTAGARWRRVSSYIAAACLAVAMVSALIFALNFEPAEVLKTAYDWKTLVLSDGTVVQAGPRTELFIRYTHSKRSIELVSGEAMFDVAKNPQRPFIVSAGVATARALGTRFAVSVESADESVITVDEGVVAVKRSGGGGPSLTLNASYEVHVSRGRELVANLQPEHG